MKKARRISLSLNKKVISTFKTTQVLGGSTLGCTITSGACNSSLDNHQCPLACN